MKAPLYGLVMAGGFSRRMGRDKALVEYNGQSQVAWTAELLDRHCEKVFVSCREGQDLGEIDPHRFPRVHDRQEGRGPMEGICAASAQHPEAAWLVVACDLPRLDDATLDRITTQRQNESLATAFAAQRDGLPEPLCAIYEPAIIAHMQELLDQDKRCPRRLLLDEAERVTLLELPTPDALDNINTPDEEALFRRS